jgi:hypothetical protein
MSTPINDLIGTADEAFSGHAELLDAVITEDWDDIPLGPGQEPGRAGARALIEGLSKVFINFRFVVEEIIDARGEDGNASVRRVAAGRLPVPGRGWRRQASLALVWPVRLARAAAVWSQSKGGVPVLRLAIMDRLYRVLGNACDGRTTASGKNAQPMRAQRRA